MTDRQFYVVWGDALKATDKDAFVSDWAPSPIFVGPENPPAGVDMNLVAELKSIWEVAHKTMREIRAHSGLSQVKFAERFCVPRRTIEDWDAGKRVPPDYVRLLIAKQLGMI